MKHRLTTRILSMLMVLTMMLSLTTPVLAQDDEDGFFAAGFEDQQSFAESAFSDSEFEHVTVPYDDTDDYEYEYPSSTDSTPTETKSESRLTVLYDGHRIRCAESADSPLSENAELRMRTVAENEIPYCLHRAAHALGLESCDMYLYFVADPVVVDAVTGEVMADKMTVEVTLFDDEYMSDLEKVERLRKLQDIHIEDLQVIVFGSDESDDTLALYDYDDNTGVIRFEADGSGMFVMLIPDWGSAVPLSAETGALNGEEDALLNAEDKGTDEDEGTNEDGGAEGEPADDQDAPSGDDAAIDESETDLSDGLASENDFESVTHEDMDETTEPEDGDEAALTGSDDADEPSETETDDNADEPADAETETGDDADEPSDIDTDIDDDEGEPSETDTDAGDDADEPSDTETDTVDDAGEPSDTDADTGDDTDEPSETDTDIADDPEKPESADADQKEDASESDKMDTSDEPPAYSEGTVTADGAGYSISLTYSTDAAIPEGSEFEVTEVSEDSFYYENLTEAAAAVLNTDSGNIASVTFVDVDVKKDGDSVEIEAPVDISVAVADAAPGGDYDVQVVALGEQYEVLAPAETDGVTTSYDTTADNLNNTYAIVKITKQATLLASDEQTYLITVSYDTEASGIPASAELVVTELKEGDEGYEEYIAQSTAVTGADPAALSFAKAFDICLINTETGEEYQPAGDVSVSIQLLDEVVNDNSQIDVVHFGDEVEQLDCALNGDAIEFGTGGFSVFVVLSTVLERKLTASDGSNYHITVTYDASSGIPKDAELLVSEIMEGDEEYDAYVAMAAEKLGVTPDNLALAKPFDITLKNSQTGERYQPNKDVQVSIVLLNEVLDLYEEVNVIHFSGEVDGETEILDTSVEGDSVKFSTDGFSVYVVTGSGGETVTPQCTYKFWIPNPDSPGQYKEYSFTDIQGNTIYSQTITRGEELVIPQPLSTETAVFAGWYEGSMTGGSLTLSENPYDFDSIAITENSAVDLYAVYTNYATVIFHDQYDNESNSFPIAYTRRAELSGEGAGTAQIKITDLSTAYTSTGGAKMAFFGWSETPVTEPGADEDDTGNVVTVVPVDEDGCITVTESETEKHLYPIFKEIHWLTYYTAQSGLGADYIPPAQYYAGAAVDSPLPVVFRSGYTFLGWWTGTLSSHDSVETVNYGTQITDENGELVTTADDGGVYISGGKLHLRSDATLYAKWQAEYNIVYWKQVTTETPETPDKHYEYTETVTKTAQIGDTVAVAAEDRETDKYDGYILSHYDASAVIGNTKELTALNVYYDLSAEYSASGTDHTLTFTDSVSGEGAAEDIPAAVSLAYNTELKDYIPDNPTSGRKSAADKEIYTFSGWYMDQACTIKAELNGMHMPDHDLTVYAGWEPIKFRVDIDPNYGALYAEENGAGSGSTYFNNTYDANPIGEYTHVTRNYVESSSGTWYYVNHDRAYGGDRHTFYTQDPALATEDTTFEYGPGVYTYTGWYEVLLDENGNEIGEASESYDFSQHTDHATKLRLHWKKAGSYYLAYAAGEGTFDENGTKELLSGGYADYAEIILTQSAIAPAGFAFVGWQVRGSDSSVIYTPGQTMTLHADDAKRVSGRDVVYLDAVYVRVGTASIIYDSNGGTVAENNVDFGKVPGSTVGEWNDAIGTVDTTGGTATVSGLANNSKFMLSDGTGFSAPAGSNADFLGWSDKAICDDTAVFYDKNISVTYGVAGSTTLYAVWGVQVTYNLNSPDADWGAEWDSSIYTLDNNIYSQDAAIGNVIAEPADVPVYTGGDGSLFRYWASRAGSGTDADPYVYTEYDFSQTVTGALDLYAYWSDPNIIQVHAVVASDEGLAEKEDGEDGWSVSDAVMSTVETPLNGSSHVTAPDGYEFAFAAVAAGNDLASISESNAVTQIKYEDKQTKVQYEGESAFQDLESGSELYFVYYQEQALDIKYISMETSGGLVNVEEVLDAAPYTTTLLGEYDMSENITQPLGWVSESALKYYAFAIGAPDASNASDLHYITPVSASDDTRPALRIRNTWRGFQYSAAAGDQADWMDCGYNPVLYVIYYTQQPATIVFKEKTLGTNTVLDTEFTYDVVITEKVTHTDGTEESPIIKYDSTDTDRTDQPFVLKSGEEQSAVLFYSSVENGDTTAQTITITQRLNNAFETSVSAESGTAAQPDTWTYTSNGEAATQSITFTNTHKSLPVEIHVAVLEGDETGGIFQRDTYRNTDEDIYRFDLSINDSETLPSKVSPDDIFTGDKNTYAFGAVVYGTGSEGSALDIKTAAAAVEAVSYAQIDGNVYELVLKDDTGNILDELGSNQIYYLYYPMPRIKYVKEAIDGTLTEITGCLMDGTTGSIVPSDSITYGHDTLSMNGKPVTQDQGVEIPLGGLTISQSGNNFRMPPVLDDGLYERYLSYAKIGAGNAGMTNVGQFDDDHISADRIMQLAIQDSRLKFSFDGKKWTDLALDGTPTIYTVYSERGYDLQLSKTVDTSQSGENAIFTESSYVVTISSMAITKESYEATGAEGPTVSAVPAQEGVPGTITMTVNDGTRIRIKGLGRGDYTISESGNENYTLTAKIGPIVGTASTVAEIIDNSIVKDPSETDNIVKLDNEKKIELTNSPKAICRIGDHYFYTLQSMIDYVEENIATKTAVAEMLTDYVMPAEDTLLVPNDFNITLTTANEYGEVAVITRTADLADVPLFTNNGTLILSSLTLEGNNIIATAPMIQSAGDLTIGGGATIQNAINDSKNDAYGGAVNATAGNITISGVITNNSAASGGAIYHSGNGIITLEGTGKVTNNTATTGDGGAIYLESGTVRVSGTSSITGNTALYGNGGAISVYNAVIEIDQSASITGNRAINGGAINAVTGTVRISAENEMVKPTVTGNTATSGSGGAIYVSTGSVTVSGGNLSSNNAASGTGGVVYAYTASVTISETAEVKSNTAATGGAIYGVSGAVTISGGEVQGNTATSGNGGAVYTGSGNVVMSGGSVTNNTASAGKGGAVYAGSGNVTVSGGSLSGNTANTDGGALFAGSGSITVSSPTGGTAVTIQSNKAATGKGGALYADTGAVSITGTGTILTKNTSGSDGGVVYAASGTVSVTDSTLGGDTASDGNTAGGSGGAIYAGSGNVTVSGGSMQNNKSTAGNGGAVYAGSGAVTLSTVSLSGNTATAGNGGAICLDSGSITLTTVTATGNSAINGAAIFTNTGRASFSAGSYTENTASNGGAVGVGSVNARLYFTGNVQIKDNKLGTEDNAPKSNVYLDQDDDAVINIDALGDSASIGIYVPDAVVDTRSVPGARFAVYTSDANVNGITNDRFAALIVQCDTAAKKLYWGNSIKVSVHKLTTYDGSFSQPVTGGAGTELRKLDQYYPEFSDAAISELASELVKKYTINIGTTVYASAYLDGGGSFGDYITDLTWDKTTSDWFVTKRNGETVPLKKADNTGYYRIYIYYVEPAYLSIENNTEMTLTVSDMKVNSTSVVNSSTVAGYGMVFAKNGGIRSALYPVTADDLTLEPGQSISLLIPGGKNKAYTLDGSFITTESGEVKLRRGSESSLIEETITVSSTGSFNQLAGNTLNTSGTYLIIFGEDKVICKVVDADGVEYPYSKISDAIAAIKNGDISLATANTATIEMVTDYLLPASDYVLIPRGYDITLTTASKTEGTYRYSGEGERATISRDSENKESMIDAWNGNSGTDTVTSLDNTTLRISNLVFDGKSVRGSSDGGAVKSKYVNVYIDTVDFKNVYASNGGAMLIMFSAKDKNNKATVPNTLLDVRNSSFTGCTSTTTETSNRLGGGAIVTNAETMTLENCVFDTCTAVDQAGAVFHRVDGNYNSWTNVSGCTFTNCSANAAGGLELDSKTINVIDCRFEHCVAKARNGGGFNVWPLNSGTPTADCWVTLTGCSFLDCQALTQNGGGFRSAAVYTTVNDCTFTNTSGAQGGGIAMSNTNAKEGKIFGCTFDRCTASNQGGGFYCAAVTVEIGDYIYPAGEAPTTAGEGSYIRDENGTILGRHTEIKNCTSSNDGGGIYHSRDVNGSNLTITNATVSGNQIRNSNKNGGGIFTDARKVIIDGSTITDNKSKSTGGGVYIYAKGTYTNSSDPGFNGQIKMIVKDSTISRNTANGNGGGVWFDANSDANRGKQVLTITGSTIDGNISSNGNGGGVYTLAKTVTIGASEARTDSEGKAIRSSVSNNTANNGGGIYQSLNVDGSKLEIGNTDVNGNTASSGAGGGIYAGVRVLSTTLSEISRNRATGDGGGIWFDINNDTARNAMSLKVEGCTLDTNTSGGNGGGIYTLGKTVVVQAHTEGEGETAVTTRTTISNCIAAKNGGGIYQRRDSDGSALTISGALISKNTANGTGNELGGGGVYTNARTMSVSDSEVSGNTATKYGGGICKNGAANDRYLIIDNSKVKDNTAGDQGGGIYDYSQLWLRNNTEIIGNRLTTNTAANCAGIYLVNGRTLFVGSDNSEEGFSDTVIVHNNTAANGTASNLRLWDNGSENNQQSTYVYCNLSEDSEIRVVNANKIGTWFGSSKNQKPYGFSDDRYVFQADSGTLHGIIDRNDPEGKKIIWAGPPIAKITDGDGNLLYLKGGEQGGTNPAIFDRLGTGADNFSSVAAFNMLCTPNPELYNKDGSPYTGTEYCIKMLDDYLTSAYMRVTNVAGRTITFTTAGKQEDKEDGYPYHGSGTRATVTRGPTIAVDKSTLNAYGNLVLENIVLDGGSLSGVTPGKSTRCLWVEGNNNTVVSLGENALLQNCAVSSDSRGGGGVYIQSGTFNIEGGTIRNCAANNGGGIYENAGTLNVTAGSIYQCTATGNGGGVYQNNGTLTMSGATISNGSAAQGGGVYVAAARTFTMTGGAIINNSANTVGGGIAIGGSSTKLYFSGKVNISGNTCDVSVAPNKACNVELNQSTKAVINTNNGGLYPGSYIGVYVPGTDNTNPYKDYGGEKDNFGTFVTGDNTTTFYSFVNDRNGLKGGIIENPQPNTIYWIQIFSLRVEKDVVSGSSTTVNPDEPFLFKVNIRGDATVSGQLDAKDIDSRTGDYGEMFFISNGLDTTTAVFALKDGESITSFNLSEGLEYEVIEYAIISGSSYTDQIKRYAAMPMNGYSLAAETLTVDGIEYSVLKTNTYTGTIGENKGRTDIDPYTSEVEFINLMPICKITDNDNNLLYQQYIWNGKTFYAPAVYTELTGDNGAFKALKGTLYTSNNSNPTSYSVSNGVKIQMLIAEYNLKSTAAADSSTVTLTTASSTDTLFPKQDDGTTSTIRRAFSDGSMFTVSGDLTFANIILDGMKGTYTIGTNGGIAHVPNSGKLTITTGAVLQNSRIDALDSSGNLVYGGAVFVDSGGIVNMTGGEVNHNESVGNGAGIYLAEGSTLNLSGNPSFGGPGVDVSGEITTRNGNFTDETLTAQRNGGKAYVRPRQDIYIAGYQNDNDEDTTAASMVINGDITSGDGSIWVWAAESPRYKSLCQFAKYTQNVVNTGTSFAAFRNAKPDIETGADQVEQYLYGITRAGDTGKNVFWYGIEGSRKVILRKVSGSYDVLAGAVFEIHKGSTTGSLVTSTDINGNENTRYTSGSSGVYFIDTLPYGKYYIHEIMNSGGQPVDIWFVLTVNENGAGYENPDSTIINRIDPA